VECILAKNVRVFRWRPKAEYKNCARIKRLARVMKGQEKVVRIIFRPGQL